MTTTSVTLGKSWPLVTICVPMRMRASPDHALHRRLDISLAAYGITIEAHARHVGEELCQLLFKALRSLAHGAQGKSALWTGCGQWRIGAAVMAAQSLDGLMHRQARIACVAGRRPAAGGAQQSGRISAPIEKDQHLARGTQMAPDGFDRRSRNARLHGIHAQIDETQAWGLRLGRAPRQGQPLIAPGGGVVQSLKCGSRRTRAQPARPPAGRAPRQDRAPSSESRPRAV
jgi:hypothetical protein